MNNFLESMNELNESLEAVKNEPYLVQGAAIQVSDQFSLARKYLSNEAMEALSHKATKQVWRSKDGTLYMTAYICAHVRKDNIEKGIREVANVINQLAKENLIGSCLSPISSIELAQMPKQHDASVVFCFPLVPCDKMNRVKEIAGLMITAEGGMGHQFDSFERELPPGQFFAEIHITPYMTVNVQSASLNKERVLDDRIQEFLSVLPKGTKVVSTKRCAIMGLSVPHEVVFSNPLMSDFKEVKLNHVRFAALVDNHVEQFNLLTSIEYTKRNGEVVKY